MPRLVALLSTATAVSFCIACGDDVDSDSSASTGGGGDESWEATYSGVATGSVDGTYVLPVGVSVGSSISSLRIEMQGSALDGNPFGDAADGPRLSLSRQQGTGYQLDSAEFSFEREGIVDCSARPSADEAAEASLFTLTRNDESGVAGEFSMLFVCADDGELQVDGSFETDDTF